MSSLWHVFGVLQSVWVPLFVFSASVPASFPVSFSVLSLFAFLLCVLLCVASVFSFMPPLFVFPVLLVAYKIPQSHL